MIPTAVVASKGSRPAWTVQGGAPPRRMPPGKAVSDTEDVIRTQYSSAEMLRLKLNIAAQPERLL